MSDAKVVLSEFVGRVSSASGHPKDVVTSVIKHMKAEIAAGLAKGETIDLGRDFGSFQMKTIKGRRHVVPTRDEEIVSEDREKMRFVPSRSLKTIGE